MLKLAKYEIVYGGHLLSLGAGSIVLTIILFFNLPLKFEVLALAYLTSQIVYNFDHLSDIFSSQNSTSSRTTYLHQTKNFQIVMFGTYILGFLTSYFLIDHRAFLLASFIVLGGVLYTFKAKDITKKMIGFKNFYIALFWSLLAFLVPFSTYDDIINTVFIIFVLFIFLRWIINSVFFDIKDYHDDKKKKLQTLPVFWGLEKTISILHFVNILSALLIILGVYLSYLPFYSVILVVFPIYSFIYLSQARNLDQHRLKAISYIMVDGEYLLWPLSIFLAKILFRA